MSVISDALKAAQRERARRASGGAPTVAPILVQLRSKPHSGGGHRLLLLSGIGALVLGGAAFAAFQFNRKPTLPAVPPLTSTILAEALAADSAPAATPNAKAPVVVAGDGSSRAASLAASPGRQTAQVTAASSVAVPPSSSPRDTLAVPQGQTRVEPVVARVGDTTAPGGRLRVAVERPGQPRVALLLAEAVAAQRHGDLAEARKLYDSLLVLSPNDAYALNNLGALLSEQREYGRALDVLRRATTIAPRNAGAWNNIAIVYRAQGKSGDAIAAFRQALMLDPQHASAKVGLAQEYLAIRALDQARTMLEDVVATHPQLSEAHYYLGQVLEIQQDRIGAIRAYQEFVKLAPPRLSAYVDLVRGRVEALTR